MKGEHRELSKRHDDEVCRLLNERHEWLNEQTGKVTAELRIILHLLAQCLYPLLCFRGKRASNERHASKFLHAVVRNKATLTYGPDKHALIIKEIGQE